MRQSRPALRRVAAVTTAALAVGITPFVAAAPASAAAPTELFISEYVEGSSNNKALEIYNGTGAHRRPRCGRYNVQVYANGSLTAGVHDRRSTGTRRVRRRLRLRQQLGRHRAQVRRRPAERQRQLERQRRGRAAQGHARCSTSSARSASTPAPSGAPASPRPRTTLFAASRPSPSGDTNGTDVFDPAAQWDGFAIDTFDGLGSHTVDGGPATDVAPAVTSTTPADGASNVAVDASPTVTFSEPVDAAAGAFSLSCSISGAKTLAVTGGPTTFTLDPSADFALGDACTLTVVGCCRHRPGRHRPAGPPGRRRRRALLGAGRATPARPPPPPSRPSRAAATPPPSRARVTTRGVVVGDYEGPSPALRGFFIQDPKGDGDPATSDGIFVFEGSNADSVKLGDLVTVTGNAE